MADNNQKNQGNKVAPLSSLTVVDPTAKKTGANQTLKSAVPLSTVTFPGGVGHTVQTKTGNQPGTQPPKIEPPLQSKFLVPKKPQNPSTPLHPGRPETARNDLRLTQPPPVTTNPVGYRPPEVQKNPANTQSTHNQTGGSTPAVGGTAALSTLTFAESVVRSQLAQKPAINRTGSQPTFKVEQPIETNNYFSGQVQPDNVTYGAGENYFADNSTVIPTTNRIFQYNDQLVVVETTDTVYVNTIENTLQQQYITNGVTAGVASIIAGYGINVSSTGVSGSGDVTISVADNISGYSGYSGLQGAGLNIAGVVTDYTYLPEYSPPGSLYIILNPGGGYNAGDGAVSDGSSPISNYINTGPIQGPSGYSGVSGFSGSVGYSGLSGYSGVDGYSGVSGWSGYSGVDGYSGVSGISGYSGLPGDSTLVWTTSGNNRILTGFIDTGGAQSTVRLAEFQNNLLYLTLATFTPTLAATVQPAASLSWDLPATGFTVNITNPADYPSQYISSVASLTTVSGSISTLGTFAAGPPTPTPAGGVSWTQIYTTDVDSYIRPVSSTITGGSASATVSFNYWNGSIETLYISSTALLTVSWLTPILTVTLGSLTGQTFLGSYTSVAYTVGVTGVNNPANYSHSITATGGTVSSATGSGTFTFTSELNKNSTAATRKVTSTTTFVRPASVTGTSYSAQLIVTSLNPSATFTYPTLWVWTPSTYNIPVNSTYVSGTGFAPGVTVLGNEVKLLAGFINNTDAVPKGFWFAVRSSASQPTVFKTGPGPTLLSDVAVTTGNTVNLSPTPLPVGYTAEPYTLYGITLQPGSTYVSIA